jgi:hypothetical protein
MLATLALVLTVTSTSRCQDGGEEDHEEGCQGQDHEGHIEDDDAPGGPPTRTPCSWAPSAPSDGVPPAHHDDPWGVLDLSMWESLGHRIPQLDPLIRYAGAYLVNHPPPRFRNLTPFLQRNSVDG